MTYTRKQFEEDFVLAHLKSVSPEKILKQYSPEEVLRQYSEEDLLNGLSPERLERLAALAQMRNKTKQ